MITQGSEGLATVSAACLLRASRLWIQHQVLWTFASATLGFSRPTLNSTVPHFTALWEPYITHPPPMMAFRGPTGSITNTPHLHKPLPGLPNLSIRSAERYLIGSSSSCSTSCPRTPSSNIVSDRAGQGCGVSNTRTMTSDERYVYPFGMSTSLI